MGGGIGASFTFVVVLRVVSVQRLSEQTISKKKAVKARNVATYQTIVITSMAVCDNSFDHSRAAEK